MRTNADVVSLLMTRKPNHSLSQPFYGDPDVYQADLKVAHQSTIVEKANWKLVLENNRECHHCSGSHPALCRTFPEDPDLVGGDDSEGSPVGRDHIARCEAAGLPSR